MNKCILQFWQESVRGVGLRPDGCSIHINLNEYNSFLTSVYNIRQNDAPESYDRIFGNHITCYISDSLYEKLKLLNSIRLFETEKNNLISMEEILINYNEVI